MALAFLLIIVGIFVYVHAFGWMLDATLNWSLYWSALLILIGLILALREL